jgi:hypothetical protein
MPQFVIVGLGILLLFRKTFETFFKSKESKIVALAVAVYFLYTRLSKTETKETALLVNDSSTQDAMALHDAMHPVFPNPVFGVYLPDGTNEQAAYSIARKYVGNFAALASKYKLIYDRDLAIELQAEGIYNEFLQITNGGAAPTQPGTITSTPQTVNLLTGKAYSVKAGWVVRSLSGDALRNTKAGEQFTVLGIERSTKKGGVLSDWVKVRYYANLVSLPTEGYISIGAFNPY